jgi:hypothetical protein
MNTEGHAVRRASARRGREPSSAGKRQRDALPTHLQVHLIIFVRFGVWKGLQTVRARVPHGGQTLGPPAAPVPVCADL